MTRRDQFGHDVASMAAELVQDLQVLALQAFDALTEGERSKLDDEGNPFFLVRAICMVMGEEALSDRFDCEAIRPLIRKVRYTLNRRYWRR